MPHARGGMKGFLLVYLSTSLLLVGMFSYYHEATHSMINSRFGNCTTSFEVGFCGLVSIPSNCTFSSREEYYYNAVLNSENEIMGYATLSVILAICLMGLLIKITPNSMQPRTE